jgi:hypothetical protein
MKKKPMSFLAKLAVSAFNTKYTEAEESLGANAVVCDGSRRPRTVPSLRAQEAIRTFRRALRD